MIRPRPGESAAERQDRVVNFMDDESFSDRIGPLPPDVDAMFRCTLTRSSGEPEELAAGYGVGYFHLVWDRSSGLSRGIVGGPSTMIERLASMTPEIRCGARATLVEESGDGVRVKYEDGGGEHVVTAAAAVLAVPAPVAAELAPGLPGETAAALREVHYGQYAVGAFLVEGKAPLPWDGLYAVATPGRSFGMAYNIGNVQLQPGAPRPAQSSVMVYAAADLGARLLQEDDETIARRFRDDLCAVFPEVTRRIEDVVSSAGRAASRSRTWGAAVCRLADPAARPPPSGRRLPGHALRGDVRRERRGRRPSHPRAAAAAEGRGAFGGSSLDDSLFPAEVAAVSTSGAGDAGGSVEGRAETRRGLLADSALLSVAVVWGLNFVVIKDAIADTGPMTYLLWRHIAAAIMLAVVMPRPVRETTRRDWLYGAVLGLFLFIAFVTQTIGLQWTTPGKSGFITSLYIVMVPFLYWLVARRSPGWTQIGGAVLATVGLGLLELPAAASGCPRATCSRCLGALGFAAQIAGDRVLRAEDEAGGAGTDADRRRRRCCSSSSRRSWSTSPGTSAGRAGRPSSGRRCRAPCSASWSRPGRRSRPRPRGRR